MSSSETITNQYDESGICYPRMTINIRNKPCATTGTIIDQYYQGESVIYDQVVITNKYVWISYVSRTGARRYMAVKDQVTGERFGDCADVPANPSSTDEVERIIKEYPEIGVCYPRMAINIRNKPCATTGEILDKYYQGESVNYDKVVITNKYVWISYVSYSGARRYMAVKDNLTGERYGDCTDVPNGLGTPTGSEPIVKEYSESGICYPRMTINIRNIPCATTGTIIDQYHQGESVIYDYVVITSKYVWISYISYSGARRYMAVKDQTTGERFGDCADVPNGSGSGSISIGSGDSTVRILQRSEWGAREIMPAGMSGNMPGPIKHIIIHHTAGAQTQSDIDQMRHYQWDHMYNKTDGSGNWEPWGDIGYNFCIGKNGTVMEGRLTKYVGAHTHGPRNRDSIGICLFGNFEGSNPSQTQINKLIPLIALLCKKFGLNENSISGHRDHTPTSCPGRNLYSLIPQIKSKVKDRLNSSSKPVTEERIVVSGSELDLDIHGRRFKYNFIETAIKKIREIKEFHADEKITWLISRYRYSDTDLVNFQDSAKKLGVNIEFFDTTDELINYINTGRSTVKIKSLTIFAHGYPGWISLGASSSLGSDLAFEMSDINKLSKTAFSSVYTEFYTCRTAALHIPTSTKSFADVWYDHIGGYVKAAVCRTDYGVIMGFGDQIDEHVSKRSHKGYVEEGARYYPELDMDETDASKRQWKYLP